MKIIKNKLSDIPRAGIDIDDLKDLPYIPADPLPKKSFSMMLCGAPGSGKSNLMLSLLMSHPTKRKKDPRYYYKYFDTINLISPSLATLPKKFVDKLPQDQVHDTFSDDLICDIVENLYNGANHNHLLLLDDCIRDLSRSKNLSKIFLNRRHITHDSEKEGHGGLSIIVTSQKFSLLPLEFRNALSDIIVFRSSNKSEINRIKDELLFDLSPEIQDELLSYCWKEPYSFLYVKVNNQTEDKYYKKFDKIVFDNDEVKIN